MNELEVTTFLTIVLLAVNGLLLAFVIAETAHDVWFNGLAVALLKNDRWSRTNQVLSVFIVSYICNGVMRLPVPDWVILVWMFVVLIGAISMYRFFKRLSGPPEPKDSGS